MESKRELKSYLCEFSFKIKDGEITDLVHSDINGNFYASRPPLLIIAAKYNNIHLMRWLLNYPNIDVNVFTKKRVYRFRIKPIIHKTALHYTFEYTDNEKIFKMLLDHKIDVNLGNPIKLAVNKQDYQKIKLLVKFGVKREIIDECYGIVKKGPYSPKIRKLLKNYRP